MVCRRSDVVRRATIILIGVVAILLVAAPLATTAQLATTVHRIGFLSPLSPSDLQSVLLLGGLRQGLRDLGYLEGQNLSIEFRWAEGMYDRLPGLAADLVRLKVDLIVTYTAPAIHAAKQATTTIPIVMGGVIDPVTPGFVASLARPGGNITGLSIMAPELVGKQLEILREVVPKLTRVAVLGNPVNPGHAPQVRYALEAARALKVDLDFLEARGPNEIDSAFTAMTNKGTAAIIVLADAMLEAHRTRVTELAARYRLPAVYGLKDFVEVGGLMFYGASSGGWRRVALYVDKILKGAKPADLPVEQPTKFELVINLKTAKALGLRISPSLLLRADQVIE
jgi:putative tryptophan/tyrosine transport system substrate-binding protein